MTKLYEEQKQKTKSSRGYAGWYNNWYLRSMLEYIVARYLVQLSILFKHIRIEYEPEYRTYNVNGKNYKPDFYIYKNNKITHIIEVKYDKKEADLYKMLYGGFFKEHNIVYVVLHNSYIKNHILKRANVTDNEILEWKKASHYDCSGKNNPAFGRKNTKETKRKIGEKTRQRCQDVEYLQRFKAAIKGSYEGKNGELRRKNISKNRKRIAALKNPLVIYECAFCKKSSTIKSSYVKMMYFKYGFVTCKGTRCCFNMLIREDRVKKPKWKENNKSKERFKNMLVKIGKQIYNVYGSVDDLTINKAKEDGVLYLKSPFSLTTVSKYYETKENFMEKINGKNNFNRKGSRD